MPLTDLAAFPPFLRFDLIKLVMSSSDYDTENAWDKQSIVEKCQFFEDHMKSIDQIMDDSILLFSGAVDANNAACFSDHSELLKYLSDRILPMCVKLRGYDLGIIVENSDKSAGKCVLTSLLHLPQIICCSIVKIQIYDTDQMKLPVEEISNWLHRKRAGKRRRLLNIYFCEAESTVCIVDHLKEVLV